ncbi:MAG: hypothetical protein M1343_03405 [Chloroflexi bacterium]|nr:hypothetical protein [Chloroflexota bacterium]
MKKYEREIADLLDKMDKFIPDESPSHRARRSFDRYIRRAMSAIPSWSTIASWDITPTSLMVASIAFAFAAALLSSILRPAAPLASIASVALLLAAIILQALGRRRRPERRWRGRVIDLDDYRRTSAFGLGYRWRMVWNRFWRGRKKY